MSNLFRQKSMDRITEGGKFAELVERQRLDAQMMDSSNLTQHNIASFEHHSPFG